jgi:hypothetical protein
MRLARIELGLGIASAVLGCVAVAFAFFGPGYCSSDPTPVCVSVAEEQGLGTFLPLLVIFGLLFAGIAFGAANHARCGSRGGLALLVLATALLLALMLLSILSIGIFLLPSVLLAFIALVVGLAASDRRAMK